MLIYSLTFCAKNKKIILSKEDLSLFFPHFLHFLADFLHPPCGFLPKKALFRKQTARIPEQFRNKARNTVVNKRQELTRIDIQ